MEQKVEQLDQKVDRLGGGGLIAWRAAPTSWRADLISWNRGLTESWRNSMAEDHVWLLTSTVPPILITVPIGIVMNPPNTRQLWPPHSR